MTRKGKTDHAWEVLFNRHNLIDQIYRSGYVEIDVEMIREVREPRLMTKFDHRANLPEIFENNQLAILPLSRSRFALGPFSAYQPVQYSVQRPEVMEFPEHLTAIDPNNLYSESAALHCADVTGMISEVIGEPAEWVLSGRMSSGEFHYRVHERSMIQSHRLAVTNAQLEIDAGFESNGSILLIEAKLEAVDDFIIRQLYYPYRLWRRRVSKTVIPTLFTFSNDLFSFFVYRFTDPEDYNSIKLVSARHFVLSHNAIELDDIIEVLRTARRTPEPEIPFPQADRFSRVVDLLGLLMDRDMATDEITLNYGFDARQTYYYADAARYLGLVALENKRTPIGRETIIRLTDRARKIMGMPYKQKYLAIVQSIVEHSPFSEALALYINQSGPPTTEDVVHIMRGHALWGVKAVSTLRRRAQTIRRWLDWILELTEPILSGGD